MSDTHNSVCLVLGRETSLQANILLYLGRLHKHLVSVLYATETEDYSHIDK